MRSPGCDKIATVNTTEVWIVPNMRAVNSTSGHVDTWNGGEDTNRSQPGYLPLREVEPTPSTRQLSSLPHIGGGLHLAVLNLSYTTTHSTSTYYLALPTKVLSDL